MRKGRGGGGSRRWGTSGTSRAGRLERAAWRRSLSRARRGRSPPPLHAPLLGQLQGGSVGAKRARDGDLQRVDHHDERADLARSHARLHPLDRDDGAWQGERARDVAGQIVRENSAPTGCAAGDCDPLLRHLYRGGKGELGGGGGRIGVGTLVLEGAARLDVHRVRGHVVGREGVLGAAQLQRSLKELRARGSGGARW